MCPTLIEGGHGPILTVLVTHSYQNTFVAYQTPKLICDGNGNILVKIVGYSVSSVMVDGCIFSTTDDTSIRLYR